MGSTATVTGLTTANGGITSTGITNTTGILSGGVVFQDGNGGYHSTNAPAVSAANMTSIPLNNGTGTVPAASIPTNLVGNWYNYARITNSTASGTTNSTNSSWLFNTNNCRGTNVILSSNIQVGSRIHFEASLPNEWDYNGPLNMYVKFNGVSILLDTLNYTGSTAKLLYRICGDTDFTSLGTNGTVTCVTHNYQISTANGDGFTTNVITVDTTTNVNFNVGVNQGTAQASSFILWQQGDIEFSP
jgi:hypothetical protein